jgi:O-methyltransferase
MASKMRALERGCRSWINGLLQRVLSTIDNPTIGASPELRAVLRSVRPMTMASPKRVVALWEAVDYVVRNSIAGDFVECGVWKGGSSIAAALAFKHFGDTTRRLYLFDTFEGMTLPTGFDREVTTGRLATNIVNEDFGGKPGAWCNSPLEEVKQNLEATGYPADKVILVKGKVEETIPAAAPRQIAILRLDTDWYESTKHELEHLFPRLQIGGVLIIDDYGHWEGARRAVDEYISANRMPLLLNRIDYTGRIAVRVA